MPDAAAWAEVLLRWIHYIAGITWIGLLYFFNFINAGFLKGLDAGQKGVVVPRLMPSALNYFRHGATVTVLAGLVLIFMLHWPPTGSGGKAIWIGGILGIIMMINVHAIIWPNQKKILGMVSATDEEKNKARRTALLASRTNTLLSFPMLLFMGASAHGLPF